MNTEHTGQGAPFDETLPATEPRITSPQPAPAGDWQKDAANELAMLVSNLLVQVHAKNSEAVNRLSLGFRDSAMAVIAQHAPTQQQAEAGSEVLREALVHLLVVLPMAKGYAHAHPVGNNQKMVDAAYEFVNRDAASPRPESPEGEVRDCLRELITEANSYMGIGFDHSNESDKLKTATDRAERLLAALPAKGPGPRSDTERLDWLEADGHELCWDDQQPGVERATDGERFFGNTLREAIDAAMSSPPASHSKQREQQT